MLVTLAYTVGTILLGLLIGLLVGLGRLSRSKLLNIPLIGFIEAFRCTPLLVQIVWFYYALPVLLGDPDSGDGGGGDDVVAVIPPRSTRRYSVAASFRSSRANGTPRARSGCALER